jgi:hypothetical protein
LAAGGLVAALVSVACSEASGPEGPSAVASTATPTAIASPRETPTPTATQVPTPSPTATSAYVNGIPVVSSVDESERYWLTLPASPESIDGAPIVDDLLDNGFTQLALVISDGILTAPVAGTYQQVLMLPGSNFGDVAFYVIRKDNDELVGCFFDPSTTVLPNDVLQRGDPIALIHQTMNKGAATGYSVICGEMNSSGRNKPLELVGGVPTAYSPE